MPILPQCLEGFYGERRSHHALPLSPTLTPLLTPYANPPSMP